MSDGKVMQKYYPPDFDPEAVKRHADVLRVSQRHKRRKGGRRLMDMRMLWPFTIQCSKCEDFNMVGKKFNSRVERVRNETYLGVPIWRIWGRCQHCRNELCLKTDPKNTDYILELGGKRMFDAATAKKEQEEEERQLKEKVENADTVEALEIKALNTAEEVKALEQLDELRRINRRLMSMPDELSDKALIRLAELESQEAEKSERRIDEDALEDEARELFQQKQLGGGGDSEDDSSEEVEPDEDEAERPTKQTKQAGSKMFSGPEKAVLESQFAHIKPVEAAPRDNVDALLEDYDSAGD